MVEEEEPIESLADILGELWGEFQKKGGAAQLFEDLVEFLEDQDVTSTRVSNKGGQAQKMEAVNKLTDQEQVAPSSSSAVDIELAKLKKQMGIK
jgi:hypothetical protein